MTEALTDLASLRDEKEGELGSCMPAPDRRPPVRPRCAKAAAARGARCAHVQLYYVVLCSMQRPEGQSVSPGREP